MAEKTNSFQPKNRKEWRKWLEKNNSIKENVWLVIYHKKSGVPTITYDEAVEEALCFGWIDSKPNKRDDQSSYRFFSRRKPTSAWSKLNKTRIEKLSRSRLIAPQGQAAIDLAKMNGAWYALDKVEKLILPNDLRKAFSKNKTALKHFTSFPPGSKKIILSWINSAKLPPTRKKRIEETVTLAAVNKRANHYLRH